MPIVSWLDCLFLVLSFVCFCLFCGLGLLWFGVEIFFFFVFCFCLFVFCLLVGCLGGGVIWGCFVFVFCLVLVRFVCLTSLLHAIVIQGRICSGTCSCCHTEVEAADHSYYFTQSQNTDTGTTSRGTGPSAPTSKSPV